MIIPDLESVKALIERGVSPPRISRSALLALDPATHTGLYLLTNPVAGKGLLAASIGGAWVYVADGSAVS